jgi:G:T-mismatch repair DNA endonuclease (very short patch repair protein)
MTPKVTRQKNMGMSYVRPGIRMTVLVRVSRNLPDKLTVVGRDPLLLSKRRPHLKMHEWFWNPEKCGHGLLMGPETKNDFWQRPVTNYCSALLGSAVSG